MNETQAWNIGRILLTGGKTEVHFIDNVSHTDWPWIEPGSLQ